MGYLVLIAIICFIFYVKLGILGVILVLAITITLFNMAVNESKKKDDEIKIKKAMEKADKDAQKKLKEEQNSRERDIAKKKLKAYVNKMNGIIYDTPQPITGCYYESVSLAMIGEKDGSHSYLYCKYAGEDHCAFCKNRYTVKTPNGKFQYGSSQNCIKDYFVSNDIY